MAQKYNICYMVEVYHDIWRKSQDGAKEAGPNAKGVSRCVGGEFRNRKPMGERSSKP